MGQRRASRCRVARRGVFDRDRESLGEGEDYDSGLEQAGASIPRAAPRAPRIGHHALRRARQFVARLGVDGGVDARRSPAQREVAAAGALAAARPRCSWSSQGFQSVGPCSKRFFRLPSTKPQTRSK